MRNNSCIIPEDFQAYIHECYDSYTDANEFKKWFGTSNDTAWVYQDESDLGSSPFEGKVATYGGGGFAQDLGLWYQDSKSKVDDLFESLWIDRGTRAVIMDFTLYNGNINLFCIVRSTESSIFVLFHSFFFYFIFYLFFSFILFFFLIV